MEGGKVPSLNLALWKLEKLERFSLKEVEQIVWYGLCISPTT